MQQSLSPGRRELIRLVSGETAALGFPLYLVGGFVRDLLLGLDSQDFDLVVEGNAIVAGETLAGKFGGKLIAHSRFLTAKWIVPPSMRIPEVTFVDLISARSEIYKHPAALPTIKPGDLAMDLRRRDFTINALALRLDGSHFGDLRDDLGGLEDLHNGLIRVMHPRSFIDDPTRMYRAVRYEQRYGFQIAPDSLALITEGRGLVDKLSAQRIRHGFDLILDEPRAAGMLNRLMELDLLRPVHLALPWDERIRQRMESDRRAGWLEGRPDNRSLNWLLWLMGLPANKLDSVNRRLHFDSALMKSLSGASQLFQEATTLTDLKPGECVERLEGYPLLAVYGDYLASQDQAVRGRLRQFLTEWRHVKPKTTAAELKRRGLEPGPQYQSILRRLRQAWLDGEVRTSSDEQDLLEKLLQG